MQHSIRIELSSIIMSSATANAAIGCTCTHLLHGAGDARTATEAAAASKSQRRYRPAWPSGSCTRAPTARKSHSKSFTGRPAASTRRAQRPRRPPSLYPLSHAVYDTVIAPAALRAHRRAAEEDSAACQQGHSARAESRGALLKQFAAHPTEARWQVCRGAGSSLRPEP